MNHSKAKALTGFVLSVALPLLIASEVHGFGYPPVGGNPSAARNAATQRSMRSMNIAASTTPVSTATLAPANLDAQTIRSMHILDRPNRPFHFYGNTVRFLHRMGQQSP